MGTTTRNDERVCGFMVHSPRQHQRTTERVDGPIDLHRLGKPFSFGRWISLFDDDLRT
jgi:hypothetical protein